MTGPGADRLPPASPAGGDAIGLEVAEGRAVDGRTPWRLDAADRAWLVVRGRVDVFAIDADERRVLLGSFGEGEAFGGALECPGVTVLAIAVPDTVVQDAPQGVTLSLADSVGDLSALMIERAATFAESGQRRLTQAARWDGEALGRARITLDLLGEHAPVDAQVDAMQAAVALLAQNEGVTLPSREDRAEVDGDRRGSDLFVSVDELCRGTGVRPRKVRLESRWWLNDGDGFIGSANGQVLVVLPRRREHRVAERTRYVAVDPRSGSVQAVTERVAAEVDDDSIVVHRVLAASPRRARDLLRLSRRSLRRELIWTALLALVASLTALLIPIGLGAIVGIAVPNRQPSMVLGLVLVLVSASMGTWVFEVVRNYTLTRVVGEVDRNLLTACWDRVLRLPVTFFRRYDVGELSSRIMGLDDARQTMGEAVILSGLGAAFAVVNLLLVALVVPALALPAFLVILAFGVLSAILLRAASSHARELAALTGQRSTLTLQLVRGIAKIRVAGASAVMFGRWSQLLGAAMRAQVQATSRTNAVMVAAGALSLTTSAAVYIAAISGSDEVPVARFVVFAAALGMAVAAVGSLAAVAVQSVRVLRLVQYAEPIWVTETEDVVSGRTVELSGKVSFESVDFRYEPDQSLALDGFTLQVPIGSFTALVGESGCGKSTVLRCLLGFEHPQSGSVLLDDVNLRDLDPLAVRRQFGVVMQRFEPIGGTILENIVGSRDLTVDDAWRAAEEVDLAEFIRGLPMGMHTYLVDGGGTLSGGQTQRLMIARAIVGDPRIVILDEATSALDNPTQAAVAESLARMRATRLVVAHRLSTIRGADQIAVMHAGKVAELGTHDELMSLGGRYKDLVRRQLS